MKKALPVLLLSFCAFGLQSQATFIPDTLLLQTFTVDPSDTMLHFPSGNDMQWVNWGADTFTSKCGDGVLIPDDWFWESDFGDTSATPANSAFTSCSYFGQNIHQPNENWLITPPVYIPDSVTYLSWRSLSIEGPGFLDGYKVLVSTTTNEPFTGAFEDTIFVAAEMLSFLVAESLNPDDYIFSPGYIHANRYTDTTYFFLDPEYPYGYTGRLEPHQINLAKYAGKDIYIAFLHDSSFDNLLQIDDIAIIHGPTIGTKNPGQQDYSLKIRPNPTSVSTTLFWKFQTPESGRLVISDPLGRVVEEYLINDMSTGNFQIQTQSFQAGTYFCSLQTRSGQQTILLVKR